MRPNPMNNAKRILVVEDEEAIRNICKRILTPMGYELVFAAGVAEAAEKVESLDRIDMLITDMRLPDGIGTEAIVTLRKKHPAAKVMIMTGSPNPGAGFTEEVVLAKPFEMKDLEAAVRRHLEGK